MDLAKTLELALKLGLSKEEAMRLWDEKKEEAKRQREERAQARADAREAEEREARSAREAEEREARRARESEEQEKRRIEREKQFLLWKQAHIAGGYEGVMDDNQRSFADTESPRPARVCPRKLMAPFDDKRDDLDAYPQQFERIALGQDQAAGVVGSRAELVTPPEVPPRKGEQTPLGNEVVSGAPKSKAAMPVVVGQIGDHPVLVLRDSGANTPLVGRSLVKDEELTGQTSTLTLADSTVGYLPEARILVSTPYYTGQVVEKCVEQPIYDLIVGNITGARSVEDPDAEWRMLDVEEKPKEEKSTTTQASDGAVTFSSAVETRAQATGRAMQRLERKKEGKEKKSKDKKRPSKDKSKDKKNKSKDKKSKGKDSKEKKKKKGFYTWLSSKSSKSSKRTKEKGGGKRKSKKAKKGSSKERSSRSRSKEKAGKAKSSKEKVGKGSKEKADKGSKEKDNKDMQSKEKQQSKEKHNKDKHVNKGKHSKDKQSKESSKSSLALQEYAF
ncbi:uncharacterized protein LOC142592612 [Dermacentor variabilis]|uniref:uncharacterized protein LOC142592612 n=1 Tax=Dermacentor variabilis TaxID=34621 RepID=UPI003F5C85DC